MVCIFISHYVTGQAENKTVVMLVFQTTPVEIEHFPFVYFCFVSINLHNCWASV